VELVTAICNIQPLDTKKIVLRNHGCWNSLCRSCCGSSANSWKWSFRMSRCFPMSPDLPIQPIARIALPHGGRLAA
jgi:hypothetical protein